MLTLGLWPGVRTGNRTYFFLCGGSIPPEPAACQDENEKTFPPRPAGADMQGEMQKGDGTKD